jgi:hypothetical protein
MRATALLVWALGCKAEKLGVHLPPTGIDAVNLEDLQRDVFALGGPSAAPRGPGEPGAAAGAAWVEQRLSQMSLVPAYGRAWQQPLGDGRALVCGQRDGQSDDTIAILALDSGAGAAHGAVPLTALIALAKSFTGREKPSYTLLFCAVPEPGGLDAYAATPPIPLDRTVGVYTLGPFADGQLRTAPASPVGSAPRVALTTAKVPDPGPADRAEAVDFRRLLDRVRQVRAWVARPPEAPPPGAPGPESSPPTR